MIFLAGLLGYKLVCEAPLQTPKPIPGYSLESFHLFTRHGVRAPLVDWLPKEQAGIWVCDDPKSPAPYMRTLTSEQKTRRFRLFRSHDQVSFPPNCRTGDLTVEGMLQHKRLGEFYRQYLVDDLKFLPQSMNKSLFNLRSSKYERCVSSAISFLGSLYPPEMPGEMLDITVGTTQNEPLYTDYPCCDYLIEQYPKFEQSDVFKQRMEAAHKLYDPFYKAFNMTKDKDNWMWIGDWVIAYLCNGQEIPGVDVSPYLEQLVNDAAFYATGFYDFLPPGAAGAQIWRLLFRNLDSQLINKTASKFHLYSGHDLTIEALLYTIGWRTDAAPTFRSHATVEIWKSEQKGRIIRVTLNGKVIELQKNKAETMELSEFREWIKDRLKYCPNN